MEVLYDDRSHSYYTMIGSSKRFYTSCTTVIGKFKEPFDPISKSIAYAAKHGNTPEYWQGVWANKRATACEVGTMIHNMKENALYSSTTLERPVISTAKVRLLNYHTLEDGIYPELKLWHHFWLIAGRADICVIETINGQRYMSIFDHKTNELKHESFQFRNGAYKMMLPPLNGLMDCNMVHYTLQLSLYMYMAEYLGFKPGKMVINNIDKDTLNCVPYLITYLKENIEVMLKYARIHKMI